MKSEMDRGGGMNRELPLTGGKKAALRDVLRVTIFRRRGSRFWQARVSIFDEAAARRKVRRLSTGTMLASPAREFAGLLFREESRRLRK